MKTMRIRSLVLGAVALAGCQQAAEPSSTDAPAIAAETGVKALVRDTLDRPEREFRGEIGEVRIFESPDGKGLGRVSFWILLRSGEEKLVTTLDLESVEELDRLKTEGVAFAGNRIGLNHALSEDEPQRVTNQGSILFKMDRSRVRGAVEAVFSDGATIGATFSGAAPRVSCWSAGPAEGLGGFDEVAPPVSYRPAPADAAFCREARALLDLGASIE
jgi:hypothetical protein